MAGLKCVPVMVVVDGPEPETTAKTNVAANGMNVVLSVFERLRHVNVASPNIFRVNENVTVPIMRFILSNEDR